MEQELNRIASFAAIPNSGNLKINPIILAKNGFYYSEIGERIMCHKCKLALDGWTSNDDLMEIHRLESPGCELVSGNMEISRPERFETQNSASPGLPTSDITRECNIDRSRPDFVKLRDEEIRLSTFYDWPQSAHANPLELARDGLFYTGSQDRVQCAFCQGYMGNWEPADVPSHEHKKHFPECAFVREQEIWNRAKEVSSNAGSRQSNRTGVQSDMSDTQRLRREPVRPEVKEQDHLLAQSTCYLSPKHPEYSDIARRIDTFKGGVVSTGQTPEVLADAGFFYIGPGDKVKCFYCDGNLNQWQPNDDPWNEHGKWFPECPHLKTRRIASRSPTIEPRKTPIGVGSYSVDPREIKARMNTATVRKILSMGYEKELVRKAIEIQLKTNGDDFRSAETLVEALFALKDDVMPQASASHLSELANSPILSEVKIPVIAPTMSQKLITSAASSTRPAAAAEGSLRSSDSLPIPPQQASSSSAPSSSDPAQLPVPSVAAVASPASAADVPGSHSAAERKSIEKGALEYAEENRRLRDARTCKVCMDAEVDTVFLPCGHLVCCDECSSAMRHCPICRNCIVGTVKTFIS